MNLQQCQYVVTIAECGSIREASKQLYLAQSSLSTAIKELEDELGITLFSRSQKGSQLTEDGADFLDHAKKILSYVDIIETRYHSNSELKHFSVSSQHYDFASQAFSEIVAEYGSNCKELRFFETSTYKVLEDVKNFDSELGILYLNESNQRVIKKYINEFNLIFETLTDSPAHVFVRSEHPLAAREVISKKELREYPMIRFSQDGNTSLHFSEDILEPKLHQTEIVVSDRGTVLNLLNQTDAYLLGSGLLTSYVKENLNVIPLEGFESITIGWIRHENRSLSEIGERYIEMIKETLSDK